MVWCQLINIKNPGAEEKKIDAISLSRQINISFRKKCTWFLIADFLQIYAL